MKTKTSITLSSSLLDEIDRQVDSETSRSAFIETVLRDYLREKSRRALQAKDLQLLNAAADRLNREAEEVMEYQSFESNSQ
jgi:metal-responsive CopG/Arc/MetJ family transcriptional regulator